MVCRASADHARWHGRSLLLDGVPAELIPEGREDLRAVRLDLPRTEPGLQRERDDGGRHVLVDGRLDGPPALARVLDPALDGMEIGIVLERGLEQLEQPGADDRAVPPDGRDVVEVEL